APDPLEGLNIYAMFRFALSYPDDRHMNFFERTLDHTPKTLEELRALYITLFEAGLPHPHCPLLESYYQQSRPATEIVLENKLFYKHFGLQLQSAAAPDHLLTQLEFLSWIEHSITARNRDRQSLENAKRDFLRRHVNHWIPGAASIVRQANGACYTELFEALVPALHKGEQGPSQVSPSPLRRDALPERQNHRTHGRLKSVFTTAPNQQ